MYQSKLPTFSGSHFHIDSSHVIIYISQLKLHLSLLLPAFLLLSSLSLLPFLAQLCDCAALPQLTPMHAVFLCLLSLIPLDLPDE